jgi:hypothetical protein
VQSNKYKENSFILVNISILGSLNIWSLPDIVCCIDDSMEHRNVRCLEGTEMLSKLLHSYSYQVQNLPTNWKKAQSVQDTPETFS